MSVSIALPPSGRDFVVYHRVVVDGASTRTVAEEAQVSQTRVRQIVRRVMDWVEQTLPPGSPNQGLLSLIDHRASNRCALATNIGPNSIRRKTLRQPASRDSRRAKSISRPCSLPAMQRPHRPRHGAKNHAQRARFHHQTAPHPPRAQPPTSPRDGQIGRSFNPQPEAQSLLRIALLLSACRPVPRPYDQIRS